MSVRPSPQAEQSPLGVPILIATIVVLILFLGFLAFHFLGSRTKAGHTTVAASANDQLVNQLAQQSGGDFNKLSPQDQQRLFQVDGGQAPLKLQMAFQQLHK